MLQHTCLFPCWDACMLVSTDNFDMHPRTTLVLHLSCVPSQA
jgi:hypothetical protein